MLVQSGVAGAQSEDELRAFLRDLPAGRELTAPDRQRVIEALRLCSERARETVRAAGGSDARIDRVLDLAWRKESVVVTAAMSGRFERGYSEARVRCTAPGSETSTLSEFSEDGLTRPQPGYGRDDSRRALREVATDACRREASERGFEIRNAEITDESSTAIRLAMTLRKNRTTRSRDCRFDKASNEAALAEDD